MSKFLPMCSFFSTFSSVPTGTRYFSEFDTGFYSNSNNGKKEAPINSLLVGAVLFAWQSESEHCYAKIKEV